MPGFERSSGGVLERGSEEKVKELSDYLAGVLVVLMRARGESGGLYPVLSTAAARWRPAGARCCVARQGRHNAKAKRDGGGRARRVGACSSRRWPGWPSTAAAALNSGGDRRSREAGWRWKKKEQFVISKISGTLL